MEAVSISYNPPAYPDRLFPSRCQHEPQFIMCAGTRITKAKKGSKIEIDHSFCLACGTPQPSTFGGNIMVDLSAIWREKGWHMQIGQRVQELRQRWTMIAFRLFDENGWTGRHERIARMIDPKLTMRVFTDGYASNGVRIGRYHADASYARAAAAEERGE